MGMERSVADSLGSGASGGWRLNAVGTWFLFRTIEIKKMLWD